MTLEELKEKTIESLNNDMIFFAKFFCERVLEVDKSAPWLFRYADILRLCTLLSEAEKIFNMINVEALPREMKYYYHLHLGHLYMDAGKKELAFEQFENGRDCENADTVVYVYLASLLRDVDENDKAIDYLFAGLKRTGNRDEIYYNLATRYAIKQEWKLAIEAVDSCLELDSHYPNAALLKTDLVTRQRLEQTKKKL